MQPSVLYTTALFCTFQLLDIFVSICFTDTYKILKHFYMKMFAELASATLKQVADWFVWLASTLGRFNANELRRADHEVHDIADGRYDGRIQKFQQGFTR